MGWEMDQGSRDAAEGANGKGFGLNCRLHITGDFVVRNEDCHIGEKSYCLGCLASSRLDAKLTPIG